MENKEKVLLVLGRVVHPETGKGLVEGEMVADVSVTRGRISVVLDFKRRREPFASSLVRQASEALSAAFPDATVSVTVAETPKDKNEGENPPRRNETSASEPFRLPGGGKIIAVASGKGGVGKSTVAANLAMALYSEGFRVGVLDADIYGPSQPALFGVEGYMPPISETSPEAMVPAESRGVKVMSIGFFISPDDALVWRGPMATGALRQLIHQTEWGALDFLLVDLPPGTGDVHLSAVHELAFDGAIVVSTPERLALADVKRGVEMFRTEGVDVPVIGIVENMAWFTPTELPENRYYIFGGGGAKKFAATEGLDFLGEIPIVMSAAEKADKAEKEPSTIAHGIHTELATIYSDIARRVVDNLSRGC